MPVAYGQRGWGSGPGPNIQPSIGGATWPGGGFFSGPGAGGGIGAGGNNMMALLRRRLLGAGPIPITPGGEQPNTGGGRGQPNVPGGIPQGGQPDTGVLGDLGMNPEQWVRNRENRFTPFSALQNLASTRDRVNSSIGGRGFIGNQSQGFGFGGQDDLLRRLLMARSGGL